MNKVILMGRLTSDPDIRQAGETTVTHFSLAINRKYKTEGGQNADFPRIIAFGKTAEFVEKYFKNVGSVSFSSNFRTFCEGLVLTL